MRPASYPSWHRFLLVLALLLPIVGAVVSLPGVAASHNSFLASTTRPRRPMLAAAPRSLLPQRPAAPLPAAGGGAARLRVAQPLVALCLLFRATHAAPSWPDSWDEESCRCTSSTRAF